MRIYLLGFMGCGKTTIGKTLAKKLNYTFIDLDTFIEEKSKCLIDNIFKEQGEDKFRELEKAALNKIFQLDNIVVSTGGGTPCFFDNIKRMNRQGISIYLKMDADALVNRLANNKVARPLIKQKSLSELKNYISKTLKKREKYYQKAHFVIDADNLKVDDLVEMVKIRGS